MRGRILAGALLTLLLAGCGGTAGLARSSTGIVMGHVMSRVCGGAYRIEQTPCPLQAMAGARLVFVSSGGRASATTDSSGAYHVALQPGTYSVDVNATRSASRFSGPRQVRVSAGQTVTADYTFSIQLL